MNQSYPLLTIQISKNHSKIDDVRCAFKQFSNRQKRIPCEKDAVVYTLSNSSDLDFLYELVVRVELGPPIYESCCGCLYIRGQEYAFVLLNKIMNFKTFMNFWNTAYWKIICAHPFSHEYSYIESNRTFFWWRVNIHSLVSSPIWIFWNTKGKTNKGSWAINICAKTVPRFRK